MIYILLVAILVFLAAIALVPAWLQHRTRLASLRLLHAAIAQGQSLDPGTVERVLAPPKRPRPSRGFALICLVFGVLGLSVAFALAIGAIFQGHGAGPAARSGAGMMLAALINGLIGLSQTSLGMVALNGLGRRADGAPNEGVATWFAQACLFVGVSAAAAGIALGLGARMLGSPLGLTERDGGGMMVGALITGFSGVGLITLGILVLRLFSRDPDA